MLCMWRLKKFSSLLHSFISVWKDSFVSQKCCWGDAISFSFWLMLKRSVHSLVSFFLSSFLFFFFLSLHIRVYNLWFQVQFIILVSWNILDYQGTSRCHARRMTVFQNKLCSPLGSGIDEYMSVIKHRKHFWKVNPMLCLNVKEIMYSFWGV